MALRILAAVAAALLVAWLALLAVLLVARPEHGAVREGLRILPDVLRLLRRMTADRSLPRGVRVRLLALLAYLALPFDLVPDFVPVIGYADDVVVVVLTLRSVVRLAGPDAVRRHWPGTAPGLEALWRVARLPGSPGTR